MAALTLQVRPLVAGSATGEALVLPEPLSLWGGLDPQNGDIIDQRHPAFGENVTGRFLVLPIGRGSSSASSILLEAVRAGTAPAAIITAEVDAILALGAAVAREMYAESPPVAVLSEPDYNRLRSGMRLTLAEDGLLTAGD
jgi:predicted aconitase with swiveling domain